MPRVPALTVCAVVAFVTGGCAGLPVAGPYTSEVVENKDTASPTHVDYLVVDVTQPVADTLATRPMVTFTGTFGISGPPPQHRIGVGDVMSVTIWEAGAGGLFSNPIPITQVAPSARGVSLPELQVTQDGEITVPYVGRVPVTGKFPAEVESDIVVALKGKAVEPQVLVTVVRSIENSATVVGEITNGARVPLSIKGDRVLDVISAAGGVRAPINEAVIRLTRNGKTVEVPFWVVVQNPVENIYIYPGDVLAVVRVPQTFTTFGALGRNFQINFDMDSISAEEAVAKAGGLVDLRSDPEGLFVLRYETVAMARQLAPNAPEFATTNGAVPVIYRLNFRDAGGYFLAREFTMRNKDIVYVANAPLTELEKFLSLVGLAVNPAGTAANLGYVVSH
jgi:polysaccharide export outer membrane protein